MRNVLRRALRHLQPQKQAAAPDTPPVPGWLDADLQRTVTGELERLRTAFGGSAVLFGRCPVCGQATVFVGDLAIARESLTCVTCRTTSRYRALARGLLRVIAARTGVDAPSLAALAGLRLPRRLRVYDTQLPFHYANCAYPLPDLLAACPDIDVQVSRFRADEPLGARVDVRPFASNQDLQRLTFADGAFDVVLTSDVMEHVRLDRRAHAEIRRVLAPGGSYLFNVPHKRSRRDTIHRVVVHDPDDPARDEYVLPKEFHGDANDPDNAALSFRVYGTDLDEALQALGFRVDYTRDDDPAAGIVQTELFHCSLPA